MRHRITLLRKVDSGTDSYGSPTYTWTPQDDVMADISPISLVSARGAVRGLIDGALMGLDAVLVTLRPYPDVSILWRFQYIDSFDATLPVKIYELKAVLESNKQNELVFIADRISNQATT